MLKFTQIAADMCTNFANEINVEIAEGRDGNPNLFHNVLFAGSRILKQERVNLAGDIRMSKPSLTKWGKGTTPSYPTRRAVLEWHRNSARKKAQILYARAEAA